MEFKNGSGIYRWRNLNNGKIYIGSAVDFKGRKRSHRSQLNKNKHINQYLQNAWNKHGENAFVFEPIEYCDEEFLIEREQFYLDSLQAYNHTIGYNIAEIAGSTLGYKHTEEYKKKSSDDRKGVCVGENNPFYGKKHSEETKRAISETKKGNSPAWNKGIPMTEEQKQKLSRTGAILSEDHKEKLRQINTGKKMSPEAIEKTRQANIGRKHSQEQNEKHSQAMKGRKHSEETKQKMSDSAKKRRERQKNEV